MEQELLIFPEHMSSHPGFSGVRVVRALAFCIDAKGVIRSRKSKKDKEYNGQKIKGKKKNNYLKIITHRKP